MSDQAVIEQLELTLRRRIATVQNTGNVLSLLMLPISIWAASVGLVHLTDMPFWVAIVIATGCLFTVFLNLALRLTMPVLAIVGSVLVWEWPWYLAAPFFYWNVALGFIIHAMYIKPAVDALKLAVQAANRELPRKISVAPHLNIRRKD
jgi:hypothetical protein